LLKLVDGKVMMAPDNDIDLPEADWPDTGVRFDSSYGTADGSGVTGSGAIGVPIISDTITKYSGPTEGNTGNGVFSAIWGEGGFRATHKKNGYTPPVGVVLAGIAPVTHVGGAYESDMPPLGGVSVYNYGTRAVACDLAEFRVSFGMSTGSENLGGRLAYLLV
jgi:hypothetical protein